MAAYTHGDRSLGDEHSKDRHFQGQMKRVFLALYSHPKTMLMVARETNILRANICRYIRGMRDNNRVVIVRYGICPITKHVAGFYTTNPELFPEDNQL